LLDSGRREVVYASCGLLVNLLTDATCRDNVAINGGLRKYVRLHTNTVSSRPICLVTLFVALHLCTYFLSPFLLVPSSLLILYLRSWLVLASSVTVLLSVVTVLLSVFTDTASFILPIFKNRVFFTGMGQLNLELLPNLLVFIISAYQLPTLHTPSPHLYF